LTWILTDFIEIAPSMKSIATHGRSAGCMAALMLVTGFLTPGCHRPKTELPTTATLPTAIVRVQPVEARKRMATEDVVGTVRPKLSAVLSAKISGTISRMLVTPGQTVKAGELLADLDAREIQARLDQATATRDQTKKELDRFKSLLDSSAVTQQEFDNNLARQQVAEAAVKEAETMRGYTQITAPFDGLITAKRADVGDLAAPGRALIELENPKALRLEADVPEALIENVKTGENLAVRIPSAQLSVPAPVTEITPIADPVSRTFRIKLDLPSAPGLRSGQFGRVSIPVAEVTAIRVPADAVVVRGQMEIAFVDVQGKAELRLVKSGKQMDRELEIVSGLNPGESLVVEGAARLVDGQPITLARP
jgi:membrane fusion protein, multidrug efflux system